MDLFAVVIEDLRRATLEQVMLYAAEKPEDAEALARAFYLTDGKPPGNYRFSAQRMTDISGPDDSRYRVVLHPLPPSAS
ncbi:MAG TPA: hypothetical protein VNL16_03400 [Chloroflexota bacterium]|nr:hypothetical protein [Chloroflexota bacterium]